MPYARGYIRVSSDPQHESGLGEEAQRRAVYDYYTAWLKPRGVIWTPCNADGSSAYYEDPAESAYKRKFLEKSQARQIFGATGPGDYLIVARLDRAFRNTVDCLQVEAALRRQGAFFVGLDLPGLDTSTPTGRFILTVMAANAELSSGITSERCKAAAAVLKAQGRRAGGRGGKKVPLAKPYGYPLLADLRNVDTLPCSEYPAMIDRKPAASIPAN